MKKQIFRSAAPVEPLLGLLEEFCQRSPDRSFVFDMNAFRKFTYRPERVHEFLQVLEPHYQASKQFYLSRKLTYNSMTTLLRQLCRLHALPYSKRVVYDHSAYTIVYFIASGGSKENKEGGKESKEGGEGDEENQEGGKEGGKESKEGGKEGGEGDEENQEGGKESGEGSEGGGKEVGEGGEGGEGSEGGEGGEGSEGGEGNSVPSSTI